VDTLKVKNIPSNLIPELKNRQVGTEVFDIPAIWYEDHCIKLIDQRLLPNKFKIFEAKNYRDVVFVIEDMVIRGAPAIGAMAAYGIAQAAAQNQNLDMVSRSLLATRPTAYDLFYAVNFMIEKINTGEDPKVAAEEYVNDIMIRCKKIGEFGNNLIKHGDKILTHCNAGALATVDFGTALAPIRFAHEKKKNIFVYVDETRPRLQGARLTAWELYQEGIPHALIVDNAAGFYLNRKEIDIVITGADRIACNGDAANKIGTYEKAVVAYENGVPFYIAAPQSTIDLNLETGSEIPIEERSPDEVIRIDSVSITNEGTQAYNPAFDVTPNKYISGFITEFGIIKPSKIKKILKK
jgi:translation initiation factor eIF-2B subunit alpha/methylthioribose-1-phosphate isomerase